jgi:hypothetical protein
MEAFGDGGFHFESFKIPKNARFIGAQRAGEIN